MIPKTLLSCREHNSRGNKGPRRVAQQGGGHDGVPPVAGFLHNLAPLHSVCWHGDSAVTEQACIAGGSLRPTTLACLAMPFPLGFRRADGLLRARHGMDLLADENLQGGVCSTIGVPARAPLGSQHEELAQGMALAEEPTWRLPASDGAVIH